MRLQSPPDTDTDTVTDHFHAVSGQANQIRPPVGAIACRLPFCITVPCALRRFRAGAGHRYLRAELHLLRSNGRLALGRTGELPAVLHRRSLAADFLEHALLRDLCGGGKRHGWTSSRTRPESRNAFVPSLSVPPRLLSAGDHCCRLRI